MVIYFQCAFSQPLRPSAAASEPLRPWEGRSYPVPELGQKPAWLVGSTGVFQKHIKRTMSGST